MDRLPHLHLRLRVHLRPGLRHPKRPHPQAPKPTQPFIPRNNVLPSVVHVGDAQGVASPAVLLDLLHCQVVHFSGRFIQAGDA